jgi:hypothetical protein
VKFILAGVAIAVVALTVVIYWLVKQRVNQPPAPPANSLESVVVPPTVSEKLPETNPFKVEVNPYDAYKNPFGGK